MSTTLQVDLGATEATFSAGGATWTVPVGVDTLAAMLLADPPQPEQLTNAIGLMIDHLTDVTREVPTAALADSVHIGGLGLATLVNVEVGAPTPLPYLLDRTAAEEVFRVLATERRQERLLNPELPADDVQRVLGVCCAVVAVLRGLDHSRLLVTEP